MKLSNLKFLSLLFITLTLFNCSKKDDSIIIDSNSKFDLGKTVSRSFKGIIVDSENNPLSNVSVKLNGQTTISNIKGVFILTNVSVLERFAYVTAEKSGFINGSRTLVTHDGLNSLKIMMLPENIVATIPSGSVKIVTLTNGVKVTFDGAFMKEDGTIYNGNVKVVMNHLDTSDPFVFDKMPGNLLALDNQGNYKGLESYGMINVELKGLNDVKLQLATGHKAKVELPIASNQEDTAPSRIPLWHFDEIAGIWKEEGFSTKFGKFYKGEVSHFSWWNNDDAYVVGTLNVLVKNTDQTPVNGTRCTITRMNGSTGDVLMDLGVTNSNGMLSSPVPLNEPYVFKAYLDGVEIYTETIPSSNQAIRNIEIYIPINTRLSGN